MNYQLTTRHRDLRSIRPEEEDIVIGDWYWVNIKQEKKYDPEPGLYCVYEVGSNYVQLEKYHGSKYDSRSLEVIKLSLDEFDKACKKEYNWREYFDSQMKKYQKEIQLRTQKLINQGRKLHILSSQNPSPSKDQTLLPSTVVESPKKYKKALVKFNEKTMPEIQEEIKFLTNKFTAATRNLAFSEECKLNRVKSALGKVNDRILTIELYVGIQEEIKQITTGDPASIDEPITIRQQMLFMDEETLIDFDKGGMDFENLDDFDRWVAKEENLNRILPEKRSIVSFRVRREEKDYGIPTSLWGIFRNLRKNELNMETYLLIRNGGNVCRIATDMNFSPRLIPFRDEIGEKQFVKVHEHYDWDKHSSEYTEEKITPEHLDYDDHVEKMEKIIKRYNRIFLVIQGLLDRTQIFHPHPGIKLSDPLAIESHIRLVRDEEDSLPSNIITFGEYRKQLNKSLKKRDMVWSVWLPEHLEGYHSRYHESRYSRYNPYDYDTVSRPDICEVEGVRRDRSGVWITWEKKNYSWDAVNETMNRHLLIPIDEVFNISDYNPGDFKMFLCDRSLRGRYLQWAPPLLSAERWHMERRGK